MTYADLFALNDKRVIVTGGGGFLGSAICRGLVELGAQVSVVDIDAEAAQSVSEELQQMRPGAAIAIPCDITIESSVREMAAEAARQMGGVNVLVNNAATQTADKDLFFAPVEEYTADTWREVMQVNVDGMFLVAQAVGKEMIAQGNGGAILQMSSIYGMLGPDQRIYEGTTKKGRTISTPPVYSASKSAVIGLTRHLATTWAHHDIRVNALAPGGIWQGEPNAFYRRYSERVPLGRMAEVAEIVGVALFLISDAARYMTGQVIAVDGGLSAW
jgi:NAD(P)-dependent dehydrogenase (short-subunit alcohol dehydrogenase family)